MLDTFNLPTPQSANYQEFIAQSGTFDWIKPRGTSMVRFMLIGKGGTGGNGTSFSRGGGGGSGAITSWIGPAIFIPDELRISINSTSTDLIYQQKFATAGYYTLLTAYAGGSGTQTGSAGAGGTVMTNNYFGAAGIFTSIAGQDGNVSTASTTTPLSGGSYGASGSTGTGGPTPAKYGYPTIDGGTANKLGKGGYVINQPIFQSLGGSGGGGRSDGGSGGLGSGGGGGGYGAAGNISQGGAGAVFVWSW